MSNKISTTVKKILSSVLLGLLVVTFAIWGVGDIVTKTAGHSEIATVGDVKISAREYQNALYMEIRRIEQMLGRQLTKEMRSGLGLEARVLQRLVDNKLLKLESENIGIRVSDSDVVARIHKNSAFQDKNGKFSKAEFEAALKNNGINEKIYIDQLRGDLAVNLLIDTVMDAGSVSKYAPSVLLAARNEQRKVDLYSINSNLVGAVPEPNDEQIKEYHNAHAQDFTEPEYRTLSYVLVSHDDAKKSIKHDTEKEKNIEAIYRDRIEEFKKPEQRKVEQLLFGSEEAAKKSYEAIKSGKSFEQVGSEAKILNPTTISLGIVEKTNIIKEAADKVFALQVGEISEPIKSDFGWHIFSVKEIIQAKTLSLEEARARIEKDLEQQNTEEALTEFSNKLEDLISGGSTLSEAAKELGLSTVTLPPLDKDGKKPDGNVEKLLPQVSKFLEVAFKTEEKAESQLISGKEGNYIIRVEKVAPEHILPIGEVKGKIIAGWKSKETGGRLAALAKKIAGEFADANKRAAAIKTYSLAPESVTASQKKSDNKTIPEAMVGSIFDTAVGSATPEFAKDGSGYVIAVVKEVIHVKRDEKDQKYISELGDVKREYENSTKNELLEQYLRYLAKKYTISVNYDAMKAQMAKVEEE